MDLTGFVDIVPPSADIPDLNPRKAPVGREIASALFDFHGNSKRALILYGVFVK